MLTGPPNPSRQLAWHKLKSLGVTFEELKMVVAENDKQRFSLIPNPEYHTALPPEDADDDLPTTNKDDVDEDDPPAWRGRVLQPQLPLSANPSAWLIRANQGHSIALDSSTHLTPLTLLTPSLPPCIIHGTFYGTWALILETGGMSRMGRNHMHFAAGIPGQDAGVISGMRADAQILIYIDVRRAMEAGLGFWESDNGVILTEGDGEGLLRLEFFERVVDRKRDVVLWEDGKVVSELPEGLKGMSLPRGKGKHHRGGATRGGKSSSSRREDRTGLDE